MSEFMITEIDGAEARVKKPAAGQPALITDYGSLDDYIRMHEKYYEEARAAFFDTLPEEACLPLKAKRWAAQARSFIGLAHALANLYPEDEQYHKLALGIADRVTKESGIRLRNLDLHYELMKKDPEKSEKEIDRARREVRGAMDFFTRAVMTQTYLEKKHDEKTGGPDGVEQDEERNASERGHIMREMIPEGHSYRPARPFPPIEIPEGLAVPYPPQPYERMRKEAPENMVYDEEHDEFVIKPGYVSEDGLIDDRSVVWHWKEGTVTMKLRGGEPVSWPFWKAKDDRDMPDGWCLEYLGRMYRQWKRSLRPGILKRRAG